MKESGAVKFRTTAGVRKSWHEPGKDFFASETCLLAAWPWPRQKGTSVKIGSQKASTKNKTSMHKKDHHVWKDLAPEW